MNRDVTVRNLSWGLSENLAPAIGKLTQKFLKQRFLGSLCEGCQKFAVDHSEEFPVLYFRRKFDGIDIFQNGSIEESSKPSMLHISTVPTTGLVGEYLFDILQLLAGILSAEFVIDLGPLVS